MHLTLGAGSQPRSRGTAGKGPTTAILLTCLRSLRVTSPGGGLQVLLFRADFSLLPDSPKMVVALCATQDASKNMGRKTCLVRL